MTHALSNIGNSFKAWELTYLLTNCNYCNIKNFRLNLKLSTLFAKIKFQITRVSRMYVHLFSGHLQNKNK